MNVLIGNKLIKRSNIKEVYSVISYLNFNYIKPHIQITHIDKNIEYMIQNYNMSVNPNINKLNNLIYFESEKNNNIIFEGNIKNIPMIIENIKYNKFEINYFN